MVAETAVEEVVEEAAEVAADPLAEEATKVEKIVLAMVRLVPQPSKFHWHKKRRSTRRRSMKISGSTRCNFVNLI